LGIAGRTRMQGERMSDNSTRIETGHVRAALAAGPAFSPPKERSMSRVMDGLDSEGYTEHFLVCDDRLVALDSGMQFAADEVVIRCVERFEGVSDPDDMSVVYAIETSDGIRGTLTDAFGVYSDPGVSEFIDKVECHIQKTGSS
jgi:hypothetical protein